MDLLKNMKRAGITKRGGLDGPTPLSDGLKEKGAAVTGWPLLVCTGFERARKAYWPVTVTTADWPTLPAAS